MRKSTTKNIFKDLMSICFNPKENRILLFLLFLMTQFGSGNMVINDTPVFETREMAREKIAVILKVQGKISVIGENKTIKNGLARGSCLKKRDMIITGKNSFVAIRFFGDSDLLRIRSNSICILKDKNLKNKGIDNFIAELVSILARVTRQTPVMKTAKPTSVAAVK